MTKGRGEDDGSCVDMNYFLGIDDTTGVLVADFEDKPTGANHPLLGVTPLRYNTWYHAAVTYNGSKWRLYLNGVLEAEMNVGKAARNDSFQHAALATALDSTGAPEGYFDGALDEVRIWNYARPAQQIEDGMRAPIPATSVPAAAGLVARWGLNEGSGTHVLNARATLAARFAARIGAGRRRKIPATARPHADTGGPRQWRERRSTAPDLRALVSDPDGDNLIVTGTAESQARGRGFSLIALPTHNIIPGA